MLITYSCMRPYHLSEHITLSEPPQNHPFLVFGLFRSSSFASRLDVANEIIKQSARQLTCLYVCVCVCVLLFVCLIVFMFKTKRNVCWPNRYRAPTIRSAAAVGHQTKQASMLAGHKYTFPAHTPNALIHLRCHYFTGRIAPGIW